MERFHSIKCQDFKQMLLLHVRQQVEFHTKARPLSSCRPPGSAALRLPSQSFAPLHHTPSLRFHRAVAFCAHFAQSVPRCHSRWMEHKGAGRSGECGSKRGCKMMCGKGAVCDRFRRRGRACSRTYRIFKLATARIRQVMMKFAIRPCLPACLPACALCDTFVYPQHAHLQQARASLGWPLL